MSAAEIHHELSMIYSQNVMSKMGGWTDVYEEEWSGRLSVIVMILFKVLAKKSVKDSALQF
jgi:hypothetical protein